MEKFNLTRRHYAAIRIDTNHLLLLIFLLIFALVILKLTIFKTKKEKLHNDFEDGMKIGNAQLIGQRENQNDYFSVISGKSKQDHLFAVIADGITNKKTGRYSAILTVDILRANFLNRTYLNLGINDYYEKSFKEIDKKLHDYIQGNKVVATLISVIVKNHILYYASIGNCLLLICRRGELFIINDINSSEIQINNFPLTQGDIAMLCSKGVYESLMEMEILCELMETKHPYNKCQNLMRLIQRKSLKNQDNATIIIVEEMV